MSMESHDKKIELLDFNSIKVGDKRELTHEITIQDIQKFADLTGDYNPLHLDEEFARRTHFRKPVVYGMLSASFISTIIGTLMPGTGALWIYQNLNFLRQAYVEEKYQNRGLLKFGGDKLFEELKQNNIPFTYGFPNVRAYGLHKTFMGYTDLIKFDTWKVIKSKIDERTRKSTELAFFHQINEFGNDVDAFWKSSSVEYKIAVVRNKSYLNWRYLQRPDWKYFPFGVYTDNKLKGYTVLKLYREDKILRGHILDIFVHYDDKSSLSKLIDGNLSFFHEQNVDEVTYWIWGNKLVEEILEEKGFFKENTGIPLIIRLNKGFNYAEEIKDNKNWYFTMGDSTEIF